MSLNDTLNQVIGTINTNLNTLWGLLNQTNAVTIRSADENLYAAPTLVQSSDTWTEWKLLQNTANVGGEYVGVYQPPEETGCSKITAVNVVSHSAPASPNALARVLPVGEDPATGWVNLASVGALLNETFSAFAIRSSAAFEVTVQIQSCNEWCHEWDFTGTGALNGWTIDQGFRDPDGVSSPTANTDNLVIILSTIPATQFTSIEFVFNAAFTGTSPRVVVDENINFTQPWLVSLTGAQASTFSLSLEQELTTFAVNIDRYVNSHQYFGSLRLQKIRLYGVGAQPFGVNNCP